MSLPRSIDRSDLSGATVTLTTTAETLVLTGPTLTTPKDVSFIVAIASFTLTSGGSTTGITARIRQGVSLTGTQIGQTYTFGNVTAAAGFSGGIIISAQVSNTDSVQWSLTLAQAGATGNGTVNGATLLIISF